MVQPADIDLSHHNAVKISLMNVAPGYISGALRCRPPPSNDRAEPTAPMLCAKCKPPQGYQRLRPPSGVGTSES